MNKIKVAIYVSGGNVQSIQVSDTEAVDVTVIDADNLKDEGKTGDEIDAMWEETSKDLTEIPY